MRFTLNTVGWSNFTPFSFRNNILLRQNGPFSTYIIHGYNDAIINMIGLKCYKHYFYRRAHFTSCILNKDEKHLTVYGINMVYMQS